MTRFMMDMDSTIDKSFMNLAIQYGYLGMFMPLFPAAAFFGFLSNVVIIILTAKSYSSIAKRSLSRQIETIGVWNDIFAMMSFVSTIVNALIVAFTATSMQKVLDNVTRNSQNSDIKRWFDDNNRAAILVVVFLAEHSIIIFKYAITKLIADIPQRIQKRKNYAEYYEQMAGKRNAEKAKKGSVKKIIKDILRSNFSKSKLINTLKSEKLRKKLKKRGILKPILMIAGADEDEIQKLDSGIKGNS